MDHLDDVETIRYVQIHREVLDVNVNKDLQEMHLNSALVNTIICTVLFIYKYIII